MTAATGTPARALAQGLSECLVPIARRLGAAPESLRALEAAIHAIVLAAAAGEACARIEEFVPATQRAAFRNALHASGLVATESAPPDLPLVLDAGGRCYFARYFDYERRLARRLVQWARARPVPLEGAQPMLDRLFARNAPEPGQCDWQRLAAAAALRNRLTIVSGGPGTGKTTTLAAILACLIEREPGVRIALAAPTGKAAARMLSALQRESESGRLPGDVRARMPRESFTIHRLLGARADSTRFRHDAAHPLPVDVLALDEASMLDLALAAKLFEALAPEARVILLGDKDQLAAIEAGSVFAALSANPGLSQPCRDALADATGMPAETIRPAGGSPLAPLADTTVWLERNYRFGASSAIGRFAAALRAGDPAALDVLDGAGGELALRPLAAGPLPATVLDQLLEGHGEFIARLRARDPDPAQLLEAFERHRVLVVLREGARGAEAIGDALSRRLCLAAGRGASRAGGWFHGRPVLVARNDYPLRLYNGDIGICLEDDGGGFGVWFPEPSGGVRRLGAARVPAHETALAMTVHRAQGSEFDTLALVLPQSDSPLLTRELLYTAATRARTGVTIYGARELIGYAIARAARHSGGLAARLAQAWEAPPDARP